ncbi:hypothetical protein KIPB_004758 [Kipferlia bialata]|uniref:Uncharacterized protein n=1 Tax=Kipferlia bialata TaxID=797122 RepID=A0A391NVZ3_9EUKA|nr:hypothetical protein KIPB_004758 [Kipferlia bialata]|eukprot:g4758.t1
MWICKEPPTFMGGVKERGEKGTDREDLERQRERETLQKEYDAIDPALKAAFATLSAYRDMNNADREREKMREFREFDPACIETHRERWVYYTITYLV